MLWSVVRPAVKLQLIYGPSTARESACEKGGHWQQAFCAVPAAKVPTVQALHTTASVVVRNRIVIRLYQISNRQILIVEGRGCTSTTNFGSTCLGRYAGS